MRKSIFAALVAAAVFVPAIVGPANSVTLNHGHGYQAKDLAFKVIVGWSAEDLEKKLNDWAVQHKDNLVVGYEYSSVANIYSVVISYWK